MKSVKKQNRICGDNIFVYCAINYAGEMLINKYYDSSEQEEKRMSITYKSCRNISMRKISVLRMQTS